MRDLGVDGHIDYGKKHRHVYVGNQMVAVFSHGPSSGGPKGLYQVKAAIRRFVEGLTTT